MKSESKSNEFGNLTGVREFVYIDNLLQINRLSDAFGSKSECLILVY
jgi:hypothetical protein